MLMMRKIADRLIYLDGAFCRFCLTDRDIRQETPRFPEKTAKEKLFNR